MMNDWHFTPLPECLTAFSAAPRRMWLLHVCNIQFEFVNINSRSKANVIT